MPHSPISEIVPEHFKDNGMHRKRPPIYITYMFSMFYIIPQPQSGCGIIAHAVGGA